MLLFVYGTLLSGERNDVYLQHSDYIDELELPPKYTMYNLISYPAVVENGQTAIKGELWNVTKQEWYLIKDLEGYYGENNENNYYNLIEVKTPYGPAKCFVIPKKQVDEEFYKIIKSGDWKQRNNG